MRLKTKICKDDVSVIDAGAFSLMAPWHTGEDYEIDPKPSGYVVERGFAFLGSSIQFSSAPSTVADFGCWRGRHLPGLADIVGPWGVAIGVDRPDAIDEETKRGNTHIVRRHLTNLGFWDASIDAALMWRVAHNLTRPGELTAVFAEIHRVLKSEAPLLIAVRSAETNVAAPVLARSYNGAHEREDLYFSAEAIDTLMPAFGFDVEDKTEITEGETVDGHHLTNNYWAVQLRKR